MSDLPSGEASTIARRVASVLACPDVVFFDGDEVPADLPQGAFVVAPVAALRSLGGDELAGLLRRVRCVLVLDLDPDSAGGPHELTELRAWATEVGGHIARAELIAAPERPLDRRWTPAALVTAAPDAAIEELVATGFNSLRTDGAVDLGSEPGRPARVCIVSYEVIGHHKSGGIGTANTSLTLNLARGGLDVTLLFSGIPLDPEERDQWRHWFDERGVRYDQVEGESSDGLVANAFANTRTAWGVFQRILQWDAEQPFDLIHGPDTSGHMALVALAKRQGLAFADTEIVVGVHSPTRWLAEIKQEPINSLSQLADEDLERTSVRSSDVVISPSAHLLSYLRSRGWELPERSFVQQYTTSEAIRELAATEGTQAPPSDQDPALTELVFFGRLNRGKGLVTFCDALDLLAADGLTPKSVAFVGSAVEIDGEPSEIYIERRSAKWTWPVRIETDFDQVGAVHFLKSHPSIAVIASLVDNSPNTVYEALALRIPVVVSSAGGTVELIAPEDLERCTFSGWPDDGALRPLKPDQAPDRFAAPPLARVLRRALSEPPRPAVPAVDSTANEATHVSWHGALPRPEAGLPGSSLPSIEMVRLTEDARAEQIREAVNGRAADILAVLPAHATPRPELESVVARAAQGSSAEVLLFAAAGEAADGSEEVVLPSAGPAVLNLSHAIHGDHGFAIRRSALDRLGGFSDVPDPLTDLLVRASAGGIALELIPAVLADRSERPSTADIGRTGAWAESVEWDEHGEALGARLRPFYAHPEAIPDLPALYRFQHTLVEDVRRHADRVQAHAEGVQAHFDALDAWRQWADPEMQRLQSRQDALMSSRAWRLITSVRALRERLRRLQRR